MKRNIISTCFIPLFRRFVFRIEVTHVQPSKICNLRDVFISAEYKLNDAENSNISKETILCFVQVKKKQSFEFNKEKHYHLLKLLKSTTITNLLFITILLDIVLY